MSYPFNLVRLFRIPDPHALKDLSTKSVLEPKLMDSGGDWLSVVVDWIMPKLRKGLGKRVDACELKRDKSVLVRPVSFF